MSLEQGSFFALGDTLRLSARGVDANGHAIEGLDVRWSSSDETVVMVDATGLTMAAGNGTASVTASSGPAAGSASFAVTQRAAELRLSSMADTLRALGDTLRMQVAGIDANGNPVGDVGDELSWSSDDESIASVDTDGLVTAVSNGNVSITAAFAHASGSAGVTIAQQASRISVSAPDDVLRALGATLRLVAEGLDANGHPVPEMAFTWSSGNEAVVTVDATGLVTAAGNGSTSVAATSEGGVAGSATVKVAQEATAIRVSPSADTLRWLDTLRLSAEAFDSNRHTVAGTAFIWSSSDESVATVDASGLVRAKGVGSAEITAGVTGSSALGIVTLLVEALPERDALVAFYHSTNGPNWKNSDNWLTDAPLGDWAGVRTDPSGAVNHINLLYHGLRGPIPPELGALTKLYVLELIGNDLTGPIPPELGNLPDLDYLDLWGNAFTGSIPPELARLPKLLTLKLALNKLTGPIPLELGQLAGLRELTLLGNGLSGSIPPELSGLAAVESIRLGGNELSGSIPPELGALPSLRVLSIYGNKLTGSIPPELGNLASLTSLDVSRNELTGSIPSEFGMLANLQALSMHRDKLTGALPPELGNLTGLVDLWLHENELTGTIPSELVRLTSLRHLYLNRNSGLTGSIPQGFTSFRLETFWWRDTQLCAPANEAFQAWLPTIPSHRGGATCAAGGS